MNLRVSDWTFVVDYERTACYAKQELADNCQCEECRHFYHTVEGIYPALRSFLQGFAVELFAPESMVCYSEDKHISCSLVYLVYGQIQQFGSEAIAVNHTWITAEFVNEEMFYLTFSVDLPAL